MKVLHLVKVRFDKREPRIDQNWLEHRYRFFLDFTYRSLQNQTNKDWKLWIQCGEGICPENIKTLTDSLPEAYFSFGDHAIPIEGDYQWVYITRLDSDDIYSSDAIDLARKCKPTTSGVEASIFKRGYIHEMMSGRTGIYHNSSSPFHTLMIPRKVWDSPEEYSLLWKRVGDHSKVGGNLQTTCLPDFKFTVLIHGNNFLSTYNYGRERGWVEKNWSIEMFLNRPVVFDVDDFCDELNGLDTIHSLDKLKDTYPNFCCTLFTIPSKCSDSLHRQVRIRPWIELGLHGWSHYPTEELKVINPNDLRHMYATSELIRKPQTYVSGFRPPGWYVTKEHVRALNSLDVWVALHRRDEEIAQECKKGYYLCGDRFPYWHGHTHDTCGNWLKQHLDDLLTKWTKDQKFAKVSEALIVRSH